ncbi:MDR family MFS transporter [Alkalibacillus salilacus]|uniref:DHA2 family multidrug resistance protein-like MFS transporter n=1 Tax=Alkalibacillus salilacus TaxID=284582 RepID=A0ABT9VHB8_9BACI|nr:MDR family MFS transporter [Alkalibacillus salilacus]MDQ0160359.1 DHA2 family multidrug resistance protein-like MFS transporter [Alkalibacillus salilacus]
MSDTANSWNLPQKQKVLMIAALLTGAFMGIINETLLATALPSIQEAFNITQGQVQWMTTAFLMTNGIMIPLSAFLIDRFSTRALFLTAIGLFGTGTLIAALAPVYPVLLLARVVQASGSGIMLPLLMTVLLAVIPVERRGTAMGMMGIVIAFGPAIGPTLSGFLLEYFTWRSLFYTVLPIVAITMTVAILFLKNVTELRKPKIDVLSIILSSVGFGSFLYGFSIAGESGWANAPVITAIIGGMLVISLFIWRQLVLGTPMLEFRVFQFPIFTLAIVITMTVLISLIGVETLLPLFMQNVLQFTPLESGLVILPGAIVLGIMSPITGRLFDKFGAKWLALIGLGVVIVTTFMFTQVSLETTFTYLTVIFAIRMFGLSLVLMPVMTSALNQLPSKWYSHGSAMANTMQQISAAIGTAILVTLVSMGAQNFTPDASASPEMVGMLAQVVGFEWAFMGSTILAAVAFILALFLHPPKKEKEIVRQIHEQSM